MDLWKDFREKIGIKKEDFDEYLNEAALWARKDAVSWQALMLDQETFPELETRAKKVIIIRLGYLPPQRATITYEPFLRALINSHLQGVLTIDQVIEQADEHIKLIRKEDLKFSIGTEDPETYRTYNDGWLPFGEIVRARITKFLGYEPELIHSISGELWLRDAMSHDQLNFTDEVNEEDLRVITLIKYREVLLERGIAAADQSPLIGGEFHRTYPVIL